MAKLLRHLDVKLAPNGGNRPKVVVLKNVFIYISLFDLIDICTSIVKLFDLFQAASEIQNMEDHSTKLAENYEALKRERALLLTEREKLFNGIFFLKFFFICMLDSCFSFFN